MSRSTDAATARARAAVPAGPKRGVARRLLRHAAAPAFLLLSSFIAFLGYQGYGYARPEILVCYGVLALVAVAIGALASWRPLAEVLLLAGILTFVVDIHFLDASFWWWGLGESSALAATGGLLAALFWPIRAHLAAVATAMSTAVLVSTLLLPVSAARRETAVPAGQPKDLPLLVHVVLDEHIGIEGLPAELSSLRADLRSFYRSHGFRIFGGAFSEHVETQHSLGHLLNLSPGVLRSDLVEPGDGGDSFRLRRNDYFARLTASGYRLRVHQTDWLDVCVPAASIVACDEHSPRGIAFLQESPLGASEKAGLVARTYLDASRIYLRIAGLYDSGRRRFEPLHSLPRWTRVRVGAPNSLAEAGRLMADLARAEPGDAFFAHLIAPHEPFVYDEACALLPRDRWRSIWDDWSRTTPAGKRADLYGRYAAQVRCTTRIMRSILDAIPPRLRDDAIVVVHGDHGSRLGIITPESSQAAAMSVDDYRDAYSTLFAVKAPGISSGYDERSISIACLLKGLLDREFHAGDEPMACQSPPAVFMRTTGAVIEHPLPAFTGSN
jgi:hypothetical protein